MAGRVRGLLERLLARRREADGEGVTDSELLHRFARDRDEAAFELLVWRHGAMVLGLCRRAVRDEQLAEDAFQAVFLVLARRPGGVRGNLGGWLFRVARRVAARAAAQRPVTAPVRETSGPDRADPLEQQELTALLDAEVARLPERLRRPVVLCYLGGRSTEDAARELGCPRGTVLSRLATARGRLAERLTRRGVTLPAALAGGSGAGLTGRTVSAAAAQARLFRAGSAPLNCVTTLAEGAIRAMNRTTVLATLGGAVFAAALASGVGLVAAQHGPATAVTVDEAPQPAAQQAKVDGPPPAKPDPTADRRKTDERLEKLVQLAAKLRAEIEAVERATRPRETVPDPETTLAFLQKRLADAEKKLAALSRDLEKMEAQSKVLKRNIEEKGGTWKPDQALLERAVDQAPSLLALSAQLKAQRELSLREQSRSPDPKSPYIQDLLTQVSVTEKKFTEARTAATAEFTEKVREAHASAQKMQVAELGIAIEVKREEREGLLRERDAIKKIIETRAVSDGRTDELRKALEPQRELLARVQREILLVRAQQSGVTFTEPTGTEAKLDAILRELAALRKDVQELKAKK